MDYDRIARIETWFNGEHENADFFRADRCQSNQIIGPTPASKAIVYCTKSHIACDAFRECCEQVDIGVVSRSGLPGRSDVDWLRDLVKKRELIFLGDLDPVDIMIYAWLRDQLAPISVVHRGINDRFIRAMGIEIPESCRIRLQDSEVAAVAVLDKLLGNPETMLGPDCTAVLNSGCKIELESVVTALGSFGPLLLAALGVRS